MSIESAKAQMQAAEEQLEAAKEHFRREVVRELTTWERQNAISTHVSAGGRTWYLVRALGEDNYWRFCQAGAMRETYLTDLQGHKIFRKHSYEGHSISNQDAWGIRGAYCRSLREAIDYADNVLEHTERSPYIR